MAKAAKKKQKTGAQAKKRKRAVATEYAVPSTAAIVRDYAMPREERQRLEQLALKRAWKTLPQAMDEVARIAVSAEKPLVFAGEAVEWIPDPYMRLQAFDRLYKATLAPIIEERMEKPPVIIVNALQGELGRQLAAIGFRGTRSVPFPQLPHEKPEGHAGEI